MRVPILIVGGGFGGVSAALAAARAGHRVVMSEPTRWIGGQLTSQLVPLDEHRHIETTGANGSYRDFRSAVRDYYRRHFPLTEAARADPHLNPGAGWVSPLSHDPRVGLAVLTAMLAPYTASGQLTVLLEHEPIAARTEGDFMTSVLLRSVFDGTEIDIEADMIVDATELGDLLELGGVEYVAGRESRDQTGEPGAAETADPTDMQSATWCFAIDHRNGEDHTIDKPGLYDEFARWSPNAWRGNRILSFDGPNEEDGSHRTYRLSINPDDDPFAIDTDHRNMGPHPELWNYRRIAARKQFTPGSFDSDVSVVNWPMNDYVGGALFGVPDAADHWHRAKQLSFSLLYWLQTEAPRPDGGHGWPGLRLRADVAGTADGMAMAPYIRESRRIRAEHTIREQDISMEFRSELGAVRHHDSVGVGGYFWMDRHASSTGRPGGSGAPAPFDIPLRSLIPVRVRNLLPGAKNIGTTQITNGCYRLHPVEWSVGEAAGTLAALCVETGWEPQQVASTPDQLEDLQRRLTAGGAQLAWPEGTPY